MYRTTSRMLLKAGVAAGALACAFALAVGIQASPAFADDAVEADGAAVEAAADLDTWQGEEKEVDKGTLGTCDWKVTSQLVRNYGIESTRYYLTISPTYKADAAEGYAGVIEYTDATALPWYKYKDQITNVFFYSYAEGPQGETLYFSLKAKTMKSLFAGYTALTNVEAWNLDTSEVTDMSFLFAGCEKLEYCSASNWNVSNVTTMASMFAGCEEFNSLFVLQDWERSHEEGAGETVVDSTLAKVTDMSSMFAGCKNIGSFSYLMDWNVSNVTDMSSMFAGCKKIDSFDLKNWDVSNVTDMSSMFAGCENLDSFTWYERQTSDNYLVGFKGWNTSKVTNMSSMFKGTGIDSFEFLHAEGLYKKDQGQYYEFDKVGSIKFIPATAVDLTDMFAQTKLSYVELCKSVSAREVWNEEETELVSGGYEYVAIEFAAGTKTAGMLGENVRYLTLPGGLNATDLGLKAARWNCTDVEASNKAWVAYNRQKTYGSETPTMPNDAEFKTLYASTSDMLAGNAKSSSKMNSFTEVTDTSKVISGEDRFATSQAIALEAYGATGAKGVVIAAGGNFPDALAASSFAGAAGYPVLLTAAEGLSDGTTAVMDKLGVEEAIIVGGVNAVSEAAQATLVEYFGGNADAVVRLSGEDRFETAAAIFDKILERTGSAEYNYSMGSTAIIATGMNFPDALSVSSYAFSGKNPIFLTSADGLSDTAKENIQKMNPSNIVILGGTAAVSEADQAWIQSTFGGAKVVRLAGEDRYETSEAIANYFYKSSNRGSVCVATGKNFPDALAGCALAGKNYSPILLAEEGNTSTFEFLYNKLGSTSKIYFLGGESALPQTVRDAALKAAAL